MKKQYNFSFLSLLVLVCFSTALWAQEITVRGTVKDSQDGAPLPGVNILEKNTSRGTTSDLSGQYSLVISEGATLIFSFVGYLPQEIEVGNQRTIDVNLFPDVRSLKEVVVVGYGTQRREDVTGSIATVNEKEFNRGVMTSPQDLLLGKVAGVSIVSNSGAPGAASTIRIRGGSSLSASNDPLIVIDGFPVDNSGVGGSPNILATINPNDIESMTVLKDASATAIYGSRASNGVIIITTKKGRQQGLQLTYNGTVSVSEITKTLDVLSGGEYRDMVEEQFQAGLSGLNETALGRLGTANTNWQDEIYRTAISNDHLLSASGAVEMIPYRVSLGHTNQQGILKNTDMQRNSLNINLNPSFLNNHLNINANLKTSISRHNFGEQGAVGAAVAFDPTQPVRNGNSRYGGYFTWTELPSGEGAPAFDPEGDRTTIGVPNPVALIEQTINRSRVTRSIGNIQADYRLPVLPELSLNLNAGFDRMSSSGYKNIDPRAGFLARPENQLNDYSHENNSELLELYFNYNKTILNHKIDATAGYSWQHFQREGVNWTRDVTGETLADSSAYKNENYLVSFFGRLNYTFKDKYVLTATLRNDGSSRFSKENRWGLFPSLAAAWNISEESFLSSSRVITNLKLRAGYGITGQQDINLNYYPYLATYRESVNGASYQFGNSFYNTLRPDPYDANIKWEETTTYNVGLDFGFLNNRITGAVDIYRRITDDLLNFIPIPAGSNFSNFLTTNVGSLENRGIEVALNGAVVRSSAFEWNIGVNLARNENKITRLIKTDDPNYPGVMVGGISGGVGNNIQNHQVGYPANSFFVFEQVYNEEGMPIEGLYVDRSGLGGSVTANELNKFRYKDPAADILMGLNTSLRYGNLDLFASGRVSLGNYVYNNILSDRALYSSVYNQAGFFNNVPVAINNTRFVNPQYFSSHYVENASFFRMDNISLGYNFNDLFTGRVRARTSFTVQNAFVITKYTGLDPEVDGGGDMRPGIDNNIYPRPRVFLFSLNLTY